MQLYLNGRSVAFDESYSNQLIDSHNCAVKKSRKPSYHQERVSKTSLRAHKSWGNIFRYLRGPPLPLRPHDSHIQDEVLFLKSVKIYKIRDLQV